MFQSELPYDVPSYPYSGYNVTAGVKAHTSYGAGVYHYFRDYKVTVQSAITCPPALEVRSCHPSCTLHYTQLTLHNVMHCMLLYYGAALHWRAACELLMTFTGPCRWIFCAYSRLFTTRWRYSSTETVRADYTQLHSSDVHAAARWHACACWC